MTKKELLERVKELEVEYGMPRWARDMILKDGAVFPSQVIDKANEIEELAQGLREDL